MTKTVVNGGEGGRRQTAMLDSAVQASPQNHSLQVLANPPPASSRSSCSCVSLRFEATASTPTTSLNRAFSSPLVLPRLVLRPRELFRLQIFQKSTTLFVSDQASSGSPFWTKSHTLVPRILLPSNLKSWVRSALLCLRHQDFPTLSGY
eukprot:6173738-Pleurochrysis_carterae.AAC.1